jgi:hypothetical protein
METTKKENPLFEICSFIFAIFFLILLFLFFLFGICAVSWFLLNLKYQG